MDMDMGDEGDEDLEDRVVDLEDALDDLKAEFDKMMADEDGEDDDAVDAARRLETRRDAGARDARRVHDVVRAFARMSTRATRRADGERTRHFFLQERGRVYAPIYNF